MCGRYEVPCLFTTYAGPASSSFPSVPVVAGRQLVLVPAAAYAFFSFFSLWDFYSETFIHRYSIPLAHVLTRLCMIFVPHMYIQHYNYYNYNKY